MADQIQLPGLASRLEREFRQFHEANPRVYRTLLRLSRRAVRRGKKKIGIGMLWEVMRWNMWLATVSEDDYKLNNNHRSRYARLLMQQEKDLAGVFDTRELKS